ncbi:alpha/beta fold hydrolase [Nocardia fusca]|uniref:alpha/beta fold hydrolase n=1 Tax=Nocardia fusca TaxID=941183 RepID=UPI003799BB0D
MNRLRRADGVTLSYQVHNPEGAGIPMLLSHGFGATSGMWDPNVAALSADRPVLVWDQRGHGSSDAPANSDHYGEDVSVADMTAILDEVGFDRAVLCGMSLGGYLSLSFHAAHPERVAGLIMVDTGPGYRNDEARDKWNDWVQWYAGEIEKGDGPPGATAEYKQAVHEHPEALPLAARTTLTQRDARVIKSLGGIAVPSVVIVGSLDTEYLVAADYMQRHIPQSHKVVIEDAGHAANMDQPDVFNTAVRELLERL